MSFTNVAFLEIFSQLKIDLEPLDGKVDSGCIVALLPKIPFFIKGDIFLTLSLLLKEVVSKVIYYYLLK
jgi:hypothetical protein